MTQCHRCGKCCYFTLKNGKTVKCPHLVVLSPYRTCCRIYWCKTRLNSCIYKDKENTFYCVPVESVKCKN